MSAIPRIKRSKYDRSTTGRGLSLTPHTLNFIPASMTIKPMRDQMIVQPMDVMHSRVLIVPPSGKPVRGKVLAIGPGHYPTQYDHRDKHKRTKAWAGTTFVPTEVQVGQIVHLGGMEIGGYSFEGFYWGERYCIHCREADVAGVETETTPEDRQRTIFERIAASVSAHDSRNKPAP